MDLAPVSKSLHYPRIHLYHLWNERGSHVGPLAKFWTRNVLHRLMHRRLDHYSGRSWKLLRRGLTLGKVTEEYPRHYAFPWPPLVLSSASWRLWENQLNSSIPSTWCTALPKPSNKHASPWEPDVVMHTFDPSRGRQIIEFEASLVYRGNFRTARATQSNTDLKHQEKKIWKQTKVNLLSKLFYHIFCHSNQQSDIPFYKWSVNLLSTFWVLEYSNVSKIYQFLLRDWHLTNVNACFDINAIDSTSLSTQSTVHDYYGPLKTQVASLKWWWSLTTLGLF